MNHQHTENETLLDNELDITLDKPKSSRLFFLLGFFGIFVFAWSGCYNLYQHKYQTPYDGTIEINKSSLLDPTYEK